MHSHSMTRSIV